MKEGARRRLFGTTLRDSGDRQILSFSHISYTPCKNLDFVLQSVESSARFLTIM